ncbi:MAG TPA: histidine kinase [Opitutus sp.]|nr:histidine kinase [Opitutus sp.]
MARPASKLLAAVVIALLSVRDVGAAAAAPPLATAAAVLSLTGEQAGHRLPVHVTGVVTAAEPNWSGQFFVQDATGGVFVENLSAQQPRPGDLVTVTGVTHPGAFAPIISEPRWRVTGAAALPAPRKVTIESLESGTDDGERIEVAGVVRSVHRDGERLDLALAVGGFRLEVRAPVAITSSPAALVAARVNVRGTAATHYNAALRHLTAVAVYVPRAEDFTVIEPEPADPFAQPVAPLNTVAEYRRTAAPALRLHVRGVVTLQRIGNDVFLQDRTGGLRLESSQAEMFAPGDEVDAAGFLEYENHLPLLRDATLRKIGPAAAPVRPQPVTVADLRNGLHHADLIRLRGRILNRSTRPVARPASGFSGVVTTWLMQEQGLAFTVEHETRIEEDTLSAIPVGSIVEVDGVCFADVDEAGKLNSVKLLLPAAAGLRIVERPSWLTPGRLLAGLGLLTAILILVVLWLLTVSRKNAALRRAQAELQEAHDTLEQKVVERSAQLQVEMTARKAAELQFKAVLAERTRLARDLHDTLEQTLTGIALQLDATAKLFARDPGSSHRHLELARNWLRQSQVELRRSIWDLRSRELEQFDLANALRQSAEHLVTGTDIQLEFATRGDKRPLSEVVEENVLRIGQEALTNIAKHARATRIGLALDFGRDALALRIEDNGIGFDHAPTPAPGDNHFGLLGMSERAKRLAARLAIESAPGRGTVVALEVPLETGAPPAAAGRAFSPPSPGLETAPPAS